MTAEVPLDDATPSPAYQKAVRELADAERRLRTIDAAGRSVSAALAFTESHAPGNASGWEAGDYHRRDEYRAKLRELEAERVRAEAKVQEAKKHLAEVVERLKGPKPLSEPERQLDTARRQLAEVEARGPLVERELAQLRDRIAVLRDQAGREDPVRSAQTMVDVALAEAEVAALEAEADDLPARVAWSKRWVGVKEAAVRGDPDEMAAALDRLDATERSSS